MAARLDGRTESICSSSCHIARHYSALVFTDRSTHHFKAIREIHGCKEERIGGRGGGNFPVDRDSISGHVYLVIAFVRSTVNKPQRKIVPQPDSNEV